MNPRIQAGSQEMNLTTNGQAEFLQEKKKKKGNTVISLDICHVPPTLFLRSFYMLNRTVAIGFNFAISVCHAYAAVLTEFHQEKYFSLHATMC